MTHPDQWPVEPVDEDAPEPTEPAEDPPVERDTGDGPAPGRRDD